MFAKMLDYLDFFSSLMIIIIVILGLGEPVAWFQCVVGRETETVTTKGQPAQPIRISEDAGKFLLYN